MWLVHLALVAMALYVAVISGMYFAQTWLLFPTTLVQAGHVRLPTSAQRLEWERIGPRIAKFNGMLPLTRRGRSLPPGREAMLGMSRTGV